MKFESSNPLTGALGVLCIILLAAGLYVSKDSAWIIFFTVLFCAAIGVVAGKATGKNVKGSAIVAGLIGLVAGCAWYLFGV